MANDHLYQPLPNERQMTLRAIVVGCLVGSMISAINIYFTLQTGWATGGSLITAIITFSFFRYLCGRQDFSVLENNIAQTAGAGAGLMAFSMGLMSVIPAMKMMGHEMSVGTIYIWGFSVAIIGMFYAIPLRKQFVVSEKLRFPTGTATAETIIAMHHAGEHDRRANVLFRWAVFSAVMTLTTYFISTLNNLPVLTWIGFAAATVWGFSLHFSPMLIGGGMLVGVRVGCSLGLGALLAWGLLGPMVQHYQWVQGPIFDYRTGVQGWLLWPGVSLMVVDSLMTFVLSLFAIKWSWQKFTLRGDARDPDQIPAWWWLTGVCVLSLMAIVSLQTFFAIPAYLTIIALILSWFLAAIATRAVGETDINPVSGVGKVTQVVYGGIAPGQTVTNLLAAGVTGAGATACADMMQDLKTGYLLRAKPKNQFIAQLCGCICGIIFSVPIYELFDKAYEIGGKDMPAPAAHAWRAMSELMTQGLSALPEQSFVAVSIAAGVGVILALLRRMPICNHYVPSGIAVGIAFIIPAYYSVDFFIGAMILLVWQMLKPDNARHFSFAVASGLLVGEGLMGIVKAVLMLYGVKPLL